MTRSASHAYDRDRRYLLCDGCGAPVEVQPRATQQPCAYCHAALELRMGPQRAAQPRARNETERLQILQSQSRRWLAPLALTHLFVAERIAPTQETSAREHWQGSRDAVRQGDPGAVDPLFVLTLGLGELAFERGDFIGQRALIDSALQLLVNAAPAQVLRAQLARSAMRAGDTDAAEAWLGMCDPSSEDLLADTAYRFSRAYVDTLRGDFRAVVHALGAGADVPLSDAYAPECLVLCAHAWERCEGHATATDILIAAKRHLGPIARRRIQRFIAAHPHLSLCPQSEAESERRVAGMDRTPIEGGTVAGVLLIAMGLYALLWAASGILLSSNVATPNLGFAPSVLAGGLLGLITLPAGLNSLRRQRRDRRRRSSPRAATAHVLSSRRLSGTATLGVIELQLHLLIVPDDAPAFTSTLETGAVESMASNLSAGSILIARLGNGGSPPFTLEVFH